MNAITPLLHTIITSGNSDPKLNKLPGPTVSPKPTVPSLYIQAWLTMGKIFIVDGKLANNFITLFVRVWSLTWHYSIKTVLKNYFLENSLKRYPHDSSSGYSLESTDAAPAVPHPCPTRRDAGRGVQRGCPRVGPHLGFFFFFFLGFAPMRLDSCRIGFDSR